MALTLTITPAGAETPAPVGAETPPPVWTLKPTRIDRSKTTQERIERVEKTDGRLLLVPDRPIRIGPDGSFSANGRATRIYGIALPPRARLCEPPSGGRWACGIRSMAFFINFLSGKTLACTARSAPDAEMLIANCTINNQDVGLRMLREGWAMADALADEAQKKAELDAQTRQVGIWRRQVPDF